MNPTSSIKVLNANAGLLEATAAALAVGRFVTVQSDYNGQDYGRSRRSLKGRTFQVMALSFDKEKVMLTLQGYRVPIAMEEVAWVE